MLAAMPPRASLTSSFSVSDENNVVVCPLRNHDGSACRKRCTGVSAPPPQKKKKEEEKKRKEEKKKLAEAQLTRHAYRKSDSAPCRSTSAAPTPSTTSPSAPPPRSASR